jgi:hypothetical protein
MRKSSASCVPVKLKMGGMDCEHENKQFSAPINAAASDAARLSLAAAPISSIEPQSQFCRISTSLLVRDAIGRGLVTCMKSTTGDIIRLSPSHHR